MVSLLAVDGLDDMWDCYNSKKSFKKEMKYKFMTTSKERILDVNYAFVPPDLVVVHTDDITERRLTEARMKAADQEKFEQAKRTAGVCAHEIRNALFPANVAISRIKNNEFGKAKDKRDLLRMLSSVPRLPIRRNPSRFCEPSIPSTRVSLARCM